MCPLLLLPLLLLLLPLLPFLLRRRGFRASTPVLRPMDPYKVLGVPKTATDSEIKKAFYKAAKKRFDDDAEFKKKAQLRVVALQGGEPSAREAWQRICDISRLAFEKIYKRLDIKLEERGESFYNDMITPLINELKARGLVQESNGAQCIFTKVSDVPLMVQKSDGGFGYDSTDMACLYHRLVVSRGDWVIYITDKGQEQHFFSCFEAAQMAGWHRGPPGSPVPPVG